MRATKSFWRGWEVFFRGADGAGPGCDDALDRRLVVLSLVYILLDHCRTGLGGGGGLAVHVTESENRVLIPHFDAQSLWGLELKRSRPDVQRAPCFLCVAGLAVIFRLEY